MAATRASKLILLTDFVTGGTFYLSVNKIIKFTTVIGVADALITYIDQKDTVVTKRVSETVAAVAVAMQSNTISQAIALTCEAVGGSPLPSSVIYFNIDRLVLLVANGANTNVSVNEEKADYVVYTVSAPAIALVAPTVMIPVTDSVSGVTKYINNLLIDQVSVDGTGSSILYDNTRTGFIKVNVTETAAAVAALVNAL